MSMAVKSKEEVQFDEKNVSWANGVVELFNK
jgi:hypothetical protein